MSILIWLIEILGALALGLILGCWLVLIWIGRRGKGQKWLDRMPELDSGLWSHSRAWRRATMRARVQVMLSEPPAPRVDRFRSEGIECGMCGGLSDAVILRNNGRVCLDCQKALAMFDADSQRR